MFKKTIAVVISLFALALSVNGFADDHFPQETIEQMEADLLQDTQIIELLRDKLIEISPVNLPDEIKASPIADIYEIYYGTDVLYISADGRYVLQGQMIDLDDGRKNLTQAASNTARKKYLVDVMAQEPISFGPENARHTVTIFTDIDCGYCRKLHAEIDQYAANGIKVNYLLFPRNGLNTPSYTKAVNVWCGADRKVSLTSAKLGEDLEVLECDNPVAEHFQIGRKIGVSGTPAILTQEGELLPGYIPAEKLLQHLTKSPGAKVR